MQRQMPALRAGSVLVAIVLAVSACTTAATAPPSAAPATAAATPAATATEAPTSAPSETAAPASAAASETPAAATATAAASPTASAAASPQSGGSITIDIVGDPGTINPTKDGGIADNYVSVEIRDRLVCVGADGTVVPCLATSWDTPNSTTYIFHLRQNVKFSNGAPFTADDAKYSWDTIALGKDSDFVGAEGPVKATKVIDPMTFEIDLTEPDPYFLEYMSTNSDVGIIPKGWMDQCGANCDTTSMGTGPFMLKEWVKGDHLTLVRNPNYWDAPRPYLDQITFKVTPDPEAQVLQLKTGAADILFAVPFKDVAGLKTTPGVNVNTHASGSLTEIIPNNRVAPFNKLEVRQALEYAINRKQIQEVAMTGLAELPTDLLPSWHWGHDATYPEHEYNPDKAKELLAKAGYDASHPLSFELRIINNADFVDQATLIQADLQAVGVQVKVTPLDKAAFLAPMFFTKGVDNTTWQAGLERYTFGNSTPSLVWQTYDTGSYINFSGVNLPGGIKDPDLQALIDKAKVESDHDKAKALFTQIAQEFDKQAITTYLPWQDNVQASTSRVQDFKTLTGFEYPLQYVWVNDGK